MNFNQTQRVISSLLFLLAAFCLPFSAHAAKSDYELLVQRNLELREKIGVLEQKYTDLENERNVLIGHVRNLQQEKERLVSARGARRWTDRVMPGSKRWSRRSAINCLW